MTRSRETDSSPFALLARAEILLQSRDAAGASKLSRNILRKDRTHVGALEVLARSLWQLQKFEDLVSITRRLIRLDPYNPGYHMLRGAAFQCLSMFGEATKAYARATANNSSPDADRSMQLISELRDWQANLLSTLLEEDATFRAAYSRDPQAACQSKGFEFVDMPPPNAWSRDSLAAAATTRPS
jgi:tetratricopeptide (TPR) repeat protein